MAPATSNTSTSSTSNTTKSKKKSKQDGRWSKRFTWPEELHRDFVSAIFDVGLKQSSPSSILEQMPKHEQITTERIKSHLQKYRLHRIKSKKEFMSSYEASLRSIQRQQQEQQEQQDDKNMGGKNSMAGGEVAAHLTLSSSVEGVDGNNGTNKNVGRDNRMEASSSASMGGGMLEHGTANPTAGTSDSNGHSAGLEGIAPPAGNFGRRTTQQPHESLMLPELTEEEQQSPIGTAMGYLMGLFFSLRQQLMIQRSMENAAQDVKSNDPSVVEGVVSNLIPGSAPTSTVTVAASTGGSEYSPDGNLHQQPTIPSTRTNIEENSLMKREMQNQMALQNKMRALKEQELAKYKNIPAAHQPTAAFKASRDGKGQPPHMHPHGNSAEAHSSIHDEQYHPAAAATEPSRIQGAGEVAGNDVLDGEERHRGLSFGNPDDFWNSDVVDEQLFEFLMDS